MKTNTQRDPDDEYQDYDDYYDYYEWLLNSKEDSNINDDYPHSSYF